MSQQTEYDLLESVACWDRDQCRKRVDSVLPQMLTKFKESTYIEEGIGLLQVICNNFLPVLPLEELDDRVFSHISRPTLGLVKDVLNKIHLNVEGSLRDTVEELKEVVIECLQWLACIAGCIETCALQLQQLSAAISLSCFPSLPECVMGVLTQTYTHCKESSTLYENLLDDLGEPLSTLFKKAHSLQVAFLSLLDKTFVPNSGLEEHVTLLCTVCTGLFEMCKVVTSLDVKLVVGLWKSISRLCSQNQALLRDRLDVCPLIVYLCQEMTTGYSYLFQLCPNSDGQSLSQGDNKTFTKCLKVQGFQMKVLVALLRDFVDYLGPCEKHVLKLLLHIMRCLPPSLSALSVSESQENEIRTQVANAVIPVLQHLVTDRAFRVCLTAGIQDLSPEDHLPLLLLQLNVLDLLPKCDDEVKNCWLHTAHHNSHDTANNLLMAIFESVKQCYVEMRVPVMLPGPMVQGKALSQVSLYHHVATHLCGFIGVCPASLFSLLESSLIEIVLGKDELCSLLATDSWCFLARYGSASMCFDHVKTLLQALLQSMGSDRDRNIQRVTAPVSGEATPARNRLDYLLRRLIKFLSPEHQTALVELYPPENHLDLWLTLTLTPFSAKVQGRVGKNLASLAVRVLDSEAGKVRDVLQALDCLHLLLSLPSLVSSCVDHAQQAILLDAVCQLWANLLTTPDVFEPIRNVLLLKLLPVSKYFLSAMETSNTLQTIQVIESSLTTKTPPPPTKESDLPLWLACCDFMQCLKGCQFQSSGQRDELLLHSIPRLFYLLMNCCHPLVQTKALASFGSFASLTPHPEVIPMCLQSDSVLKARVNGYLNQVPFSVDDQPFETVEFLKQQHHHHPAMTDDNNENTDLNGLCEKDVNSSGNSQEALSHPPAKKQRLEDCKKEDNIELPMMHCQQFGAFPSDTNNQSKQQKQPTTETTANNFITETTKMTSPVSSTLPITTTTITTKPTFNNVLERLKAVADDIETLCSGGGGGGSDGCSGSDKGSSLPDNFVAETKLVLSRMNDVINVPASWFDSLM